MLACDLCEHYTSTFAGTGAKGQLVAPRKDVALRYKEIVDAEVEKLARPAFRADTVASRTAKTMREKWEENPAFCERFSGILQRLIGDYRRKRISDAQYLAPGP